MGFIRASSKQPLLKFEHDSLSRLSLLEIVMLHSLRSLFVFCFFFVLHEPETYVITWDTIRSLLAFWRYLNYIVSEKKFLVNSGVGLCEGGVMEI